MLAKLVQILESLRLWVDQHPQAGIFVFAGFFVLVQLFMMPVSPVGMATGLIFGFWKGMGVLLFGCFLGATLNFFLVRWFARDYVRQKLGQNRAFRMIDTAIAKEGWRMVALMRFVPIPFGLANYCYGLTPIRYVPYILATCVAITPANSFFVWMGTTLGEISNLANGHRRHPLEYVFLGAGIVAAILVLRLVAKTAKAAVERVENQATPPKAE